MTFQGHAAGKQQRQDLNSGLLAPAHKTLKVASWEGPLLIRGHCPKVRVGGEKPSALKVALESLPSCP